MSQPAVQEAVPAEVAALVTRAAACRKWSNTEITDQSDDALVEGELSHLKCNKLAHDASALQHKYAGSEPAREAIETVRAQGF